MDKDEMFVLIKEELAEINKKIDRQFVKQDELAEKVIRHDERINLIWKFVIGSIFSGLVAFSTSVITYFIKK